MSQCPNVPALCVAGTGVSPYDEPRRAKCEACGEIEVWGTGIRRREFMYVDDLADALVHLLKRYSDEAHVNVGVGSDVAISPGVCDFP